MSASSQTCQDDISFSDILSKGVGVGGGGVGNDSFNSSGNRSGFGTQVNDKTMCF